MYVFILYFIRMKMVFFMAKEQKLLNYFQDNGSLIVVYSSIRELVLFIDMFLSNGERTVLKSKTNVHILKKYFDNGTLNMFMLYFDYREFIIKTQLYIYYIYLYLLLMHTWCTHYYINRTQCPLSDKQTKPVILNNIIPNISLHK